jgi:general secretion pathway protein C
MGWSKIELRDAFARSIVPAILGLGALSAYFAARGVAALITIALLPDAALVLHSTNAGVLEARAASHATRQGAGTQLILQRNVFDSATGSLIREDEPESVVPARAIDPLTAPPCNGIGVYGLTESSDPLWSSAIVQAPGEPHGRIRRVGDSIAEKQVLYIGSNPARRSPAVWLADREGLCQCLLFGGPPRATPAPAAKPPGKPAPAPPPPKTAKPQPLPPEIAKRIARTSDTEYKVDRAAVDEILSRYADLMRGTRVVPEQKEGALVGMRVSKVAPDSLLARLGFKNGDSIKSINGFALTSPDKALQAYARLRTAGDLRVQIVRAGRQVTLEYRVR